MIDLGARRRNHVRFGFLTAAAAALVVLGFGLGRLGGPAPDVPTPPTAAVQEPSAGLRVAAEEHLGRSESLLTMVRADAREGALDPVTAEWSRALLTQTRLLIDMQADGDPTVLELLEDLELVLVQIVGVAESGASDDDLARTELELAIRGLEEGAVLPRIQAALPSYAGA